MSRLAAIDNNSAVEALSLDDLREYIAFNEWVIYPEHPTENNQSLINLIRTSGRVLAGTESITIYDEAQIIQTWEDPGASIILSIQDEIKQMNELFTVRNEIFVSSFLQENHFLLDILKEAYIQINKYFPESNLFLELLTDPEIPEQQELLIAIKSNYNPHDAIYRLNLLDDKWLINKLPGTRGMLLINLEY